MKCKHKEPRKFLFLDAYEDAEQRMKRGERQLKCDHCCLWVWEVYFDQAQKSDSESTS